jgi:5-methylcytosine-specific restriction endonuclease McrA
LWQRQNKKRRCFSQRMREANKLKAAPSWANIEAIKKIYPNCPENYTVDHIIPLQGREVCGLHVKYNLQYLTSVENSKKSNKLL